MPHLPVGIHTVQGRRITYSQAAWLARGMPAMLQVIDSTLVIVLHNGEQEIEREVASPADALRVALMMLARRGQLEIGDVLKVTAPN